LIWGDAKPGNILINIDGNAILVDFGGGYTDGWVDEKVSNTVKGDLQGIRRIIKYIQSKTC
jgi:serine/threonine protein kinase